MRTVAHTSKAQHAGRAAQRTSAAVQKKRVHLRGTEHDLRALYGLTEPSKDELLRAETELESVEDPLDDWQESESEADNWLRSHGVRSEDGDV